MFLAYRYNNHSITKASFDQSLIVLIYIKQSKKAWKHDLKSKLGVTRGEQIVKHFSGYWKDHEVRTVVTFI